MTNSWRSRRRAALLGGLALLALALPILSAVPALGAGATIRLESADLGPGESATLALEGLGFPEPGLGAITIEVVYDSAGVAVTACEADPAEIFDLALCNQEFADGTVRVTAIDAQGEPGDFTLAQITFAAVGDAGPQTLDLVIVTLTDREGAVLDVLIEDSTLSVVAETEGADSATSQTEDVAPSTNAEGESADSEGESAELPAPAGESADSEASPPVSEQASDSGGNPFFQTDQPWLYVALAILGGAVAAVGLVFMRRRRET